MTEFIAGLHVSMMMRVENQDFTLDGWLVRPQRCCIERGAETRRVKPKSMAVLERLARARGDVVSRNDLFDEIWPGHEVTDDVLTHCVVELRKAFDDSARDSTVIETIPKKGFRIVSAVLPHIDESADEHGPRFFSAFVPGVVALSLLAITAMGFVNGRNELTITQAIDGRRTIAVLPFVDLSPNSDQEYFADGLSEELINRLTQLEGLQVTGRTSSFYFKGHNEDLRDIGNRLSVNHVLEGSVRKSDDELRITAQLIDVDSGFHLWSDTYDRSFEDVFAIQKDIAESVAAALSIRLSVGQLGTFEGGTNNVEAYDAVMLGNALHHEFTADSMLGAIHHFKRATELDPEFALAWERLANVYRTAWLTFGDHEAEEWGRLADDAIGNALAGAPNSEYALLTAAYIEVDRQNWAAAQRYFEQVRSLETAVEPRESSAYLDMLTKTGHVDAALRTQERLYRLDPLHPSESMYVGHLYLSQGRIDDALEEFEAGYALDGYRAHLSVEGLVAALSARQADTALRWLRRAVEHQQPGSRGVHDAMLERFDDRDVALEWLHTAFEAQSVSDYYIIVWASFYRDDELALQAMQRTPDLWAFWTPLTRHLRSTPEFQDIVRSVGLVDYWRQYGWNDYCAPISDEDFECH